MAVGFPVKDNYVTGDVLTAANMNDFAGTLNTVPNVIGGFAAGKNKIINGDFRINQRAFTSTTTTATYGLDRWQLDCADGTSTYSVQTFTPGAAPVAGYEAINFARIVTTGQTLTTAFTRLVQPIEDVRTFAGQTVTVSFWAKAATGTPKIAVELAQGMGAGGSGGANNTIGNVTISTSWARYSVTGSVAGLSGATIGTSSALNARLFVSAGSVFNARTGSMGIQSNTFDIWGIQVEAGSIATPFQTATGTIQGELAACQRYYYKTIASGTSFAPFGTGFARTTTESINITQFPVELRTRPTALETTGTAGDYIVFYGGALSVACTSVPTYTSASTTFARTIFTTAVAFVAGQATINTCVNNSSTAFLAWSAEL
jgi:hypothetical protein